MDCAFETCAVTSSRRSRGMAALCTERSVATGACAVAFVFGAREIGSARRAWESESAHGILGRWYFYQCVRERCEEERDLATVPSSQQEGMESSGVDGQGEPSRAEVKTREPGATDETANRENIVSSGLSPRRPSKQPSQRRMSERLPINAIESDASSWRVSGPENEIVCT